MSVPDTTKKIRSILHVTVGVPGEWEPTDTDLETVASMFHDAVVGDPAGSVVVTRTGITAKVINIEEAADGKFKVVSVSVTDPTQLAESQPSDSAAAEAAGA